MFSIEPTGIPDLPGIPAGYPVSNPLGGCPKKKRYSWNSSWDSRWISRGIPAGIPVGYFQRGRVYM